MLISNESVYPQGSRFRVLTNEKTVGHRILENAKILELAFFQLDDNTLVYYLKRMIDEVKYCIYACITLRFQTHQTGENSIPEPRYTILNIGVVNSCGQLSLEHLLLYIVSIKTYTECYSFLYVDHPAVIALNFFIEMGFRPDLSSESTNTEKYWSNESYKPSSWRFFLTRSPSYKDHFRQGVLSPISAFQEAYTPTGGERHPCNWYCDNRLLYGMVRQKVKKLFKFLPPESESTEGKSMP